MFVSLILCFHLDSEIWIASESLRMFSSPEIPRLYSHFCLKIFIRPKFSPQKHCLKCEWRAAKESAIAVLIVPPSLPFAPPPSALSPKSAVCSRLLP